MGRTTTLIALLLLLPIVVVAAQTGGAPEPLHVQTAVPWWGWASMLFALTIGIGVVAVLGGVGGGVLFVPLVSAFFPFHFDFVRGTGLLVTLCGALSAAPWLLRHRYSDLRLALPMALSGSIGSIIGAWVGLTVETNVLEAMLGLAILAIVVVMLATPRSESLAAAKPDRLAGLLGIGGSYYDPGADQHTEWTVHRTPFGILLFLFIGVIAGMFGLGAGWANVPTLVLLLGAPLKVAVATSGLIVAVNNTAAAWIYLNGGAVLPMITIPSVAGMMIGTRIGARLLPGARTRVIRWIVISVMLLAAVRSLIAGFLGGIQ
jgi:uncharacterized membrane protein YfcA